MNHPINLKQAVIQGKLDDFISQHPHNPVPRDRKEQFEGVLDSMVKEKLKSVSNLQHDWRIK